MEFFQQMFEITGLAHLVWQLQTADFDDSPNCLTRFRSNRDLGLLVLMALLAGRIAL